MSADNGIYILQTMGKQGGFEYRVSHCQNIEDIHWNDKQHCHMSGYLNSEIVQQRFGHSKVYTDKQSALNKAHEIYDEIMQDDFCQVVEYGIQILDYGNFMFPGTLNIIR